MMSIVLYKVIKLLSPQQVYVVVQQFFYVNCSSLLNDHDGGGDDLLYVTHSYCVNCVLDITVLLQSSFIDDLTGCSFVAIGFHC